MLSTSLDATRDKFTHEDALHDYAQRASASDSLPKARGAGRLSRDTQIVRCCHARHPRVWDAKMIIPQIPITIDFQTYPVLRGTLGSCHGRIGLHYLQK